jgi:hypothetical protein
MLTNSYTNPICIGCAATAAATAAAAAAAVSHQQLMAKQPTIPEKGIATCSE